MATSESRYPQFAQFFQKLVRDEDFLSDVLFIVGLNSTNYSKLATVLKNDKSFIDSDKLSSFVQSVFGPTEDSQKITKIIWALHNLLRNSTGNSPEDSIFLLRDALAESSAKISKKDCSTFVERIQELVITPQSLVRQLKAEKLAGATGKNINDLQLICDIRPIFDDERSCIDGAIPVSILKIDFSEPDGSVSRLEFSLNEEQILLLGAIAQMAKRKISVIKKFFVENKIEMPATSITINEKESR